MSRTTQTGKDSAIRNSRGFSLIELCLVVVVSLVLAAFAIPNMIRMRQTSNMRGAAADITGLIESQRMYAIRDNRFYSTRVIAASGAPAQVYIDMFPKSNTGASGNGGTSVVTGNPGVTGDPVITVSNEVTRVAAASAPNTANLQSQLLPSVTAVTPTDANSTPITFGPRGLPCAPLAVTGGTVCDSSGGPVAYWAFFQDNLSNEWGAVTVTPAGKINKWYYTGSVWQSY